MGPDESGHAPCAVPVPARPTLPPAAGQPNYGGRVRFTLRAAGPAEADEVWDRYARPSRWPGWAPQIRTVLLDGVPATAASAISAGLTGQVRGPAGLRVGFRITEVQAEPDAGGCRRWSWSVRLGPLRLRMHHLVRAVPGGTETELVIDGPPVAAGYLLPAQVALGRLVR
jgi:hypothetical protein